MADPVLFTKEELEAEIGAEVVIQVLDDDNDGVADPAAITRLQVSSAAYVTGGIERVYPTLTTKIAEWQDDLSLVPPKLKQLALDHAVATLTKRNPSYLRRDWKALIDYVDQQISRVRRTGLDSLGIRVDPEPAVNQGGIIEDASGSGDVPVKYFSGECGLSDF